MALLSQKYRARIMRAQSRFPAMKRQIAEDLVMKSQEATQRELYDRTPLEVTRNMYRSISSKETPNSVIVGYNVSNPVAPYAKYRVVMTGISKLGGHLLDMDPAAYLRTWAIKRVQRTTTVATRAIIGR